MTPPPPRATDRRARVAVVLGATLTVVLALALGACSVRQATNDFPAATSPAPRSSSATVTRGDITPVLSLNGTVGAGVPVAITAPRDGVFHVDARGRMSITTSDGTALDLTRPAAYTAITATQADGASVVEGLPVATAVYSGFAISAPVSPEQLLRFTSAPVSARAQVSGAGGPFDCSLLDPRPSSAADGQTAVGCAVPSTQRVIAGLTAVLSVRFPTTHDALVLPVEAVAGTAGDGSVYVRQGDRVVEKDVVLGASDGYRIAILDGLSEGDTVVIPSPSLLGADDG